MKNEALRRFLLASVRACVCACVFAYVRACVLRASAVWSSLPPCRDLLCVPFFLFSGRFSHLRVHFRYCFVPHDIYNALCVRQSIYPLICIYLRRRDPFIVDSPGDSITATRICDLICINTITPRIKRGFLRTWFSFPLLRVRLQRNAMRSLSIFLPFYQSPNQPRAWLTARPCSFSSRDLLRSTTAQTQMQEIEGEKNRAVCMSAVQLFRTTERG